MTFDILIRGGTIFDGSGKPRFSGDVGISGGVISAVGNPALDGAGAQKTIDASGMFVAPGFVDITSHVDVNGSIFLNSQQGYLIRQGVTSILVGNCGSSLAPLASREAPMSIRKWSTGTDININWLSVGLYLDELAKRPLGPNVGTLMGHGTMRRGITQGQSRALSGDEIAEFAALIKQGMDQGAFGLSLGLVYSHEADANADELAAFGQAVSENNGVLKAHIRSEGSNLVPAVNEILQAARVSKARVIVSHLKAIGRKTWPDFKKALGMVERAHDGGMQAYFDISPYQRTGSFLYLLLPTWAREGGFGAILKRISNPTERQILTEELKRATLHYERYIIAGGAVPGAGGRTIAEAAERAGISPEDTVLELLASSGGRTTILGKTLSFNNIVSGMAHPLGAIASDGSGVTEELANSGDLVHPRSTGCFPHFLHKFIREKGVISWEEGIRKISSLPAELAGFKGRGRIAPKSAADIVVFKPEEIRDRSTYQSPYSKPAGIEAVMVNGVMAVEAGELTGMTGGKVLKKG